MKKRTTTEVRVSYEELLAFMEFDFTKYDIEDIDSSHDDEMIVMVVEK